jgi:lysophospholipase L1-like esterase
MVSFYSYTMTRRWIAAAGLALCACGGPPNKPTPPPVAAPQIFCPADVTIRGITGGSQPVTFAAPTVTDGTAPVNTTCTQTSGASFPLGTTSITCTASDAQARQAACSFKVTVTALALGVTKYDAVGDSLTEGENGQRPRFVDTPNAYPTKLQALFDDTYPGQGIVVVNRGIGGEVVEKTVADLPGNLLKDRPGAVLVLTGYNNLAKGLCKFSDGNNPLCADAIEDVRIGVRDCIRHSKEAPFNIAYVFVSTLTPPGPLSPGFDDRRLRSQAILQANDRIRQIVAAEGGILVDTHPLFIGHEAEYVDGDGLHLRPAGYQVLANAFFEAIKAKVPQMPLSSLNGLR